MKKVIADAWFFSVLPRFVQLGQQPSALRSTGVAKAPETEVIDKASFFAQAGQEQSVASVPPPPEEFGPSNWSPRGLRPVPAFYPLEKSSRFIEDDLSSVASRLSECLRLLSVHAVYNDENATAFLTTGENVEMHLALWKTSGSRYPSGIVVELQRRKGDSITFHRYSRYILDAAIGDFDPVAFVEKSGGDIANMYTKKAERMLKMQTGKTASTEEENAVIAIEIAHGLLMKDRMDARQLGLESLCLLTDPRKTGNTTAVIASRVVLLGTTQGAVNDEGEGIMFDESPFQEIRETILSLIQLRRIGDEEALSEGDDDRDGADSDDEFDVQQSQEKQHMSVLHNLALAVLANALDVIENFESFEKDPEDTKKPAALSTTSAKDIANTFMNDSKDVTSKEILSTLIQELGKAAKKPHNATLSAKCLRCLCRASDDARRRAKELGAKNVVNTALDVGVRTHAKLETECKKAMTVLTTETGNDDEQN
mmetsp:Transcript_10066/g.23291  ORF Transcript_10066/g.23291 Transcript_10066/m.23291 type:complete len:483 (+) Transcript_10066:559-2007(+)|eukprot:CAMPEP_0116829920 /NCGR_PEP_ID=MMETSP0418-20121206/4478_1 /TAXON_ID=1158023 /ORGANISM="Astrosyne radiata, Strain 13vi08-1A" /LENGTH=482 /DNA_ID=CAMNT_0004458971 /DNA_START=512 /DNA_END=1960 /DNA_ORIENTATION=-